VKRARGAVSAVSASSAVAGRRMNGNVDEVIRFAAAELPEVLSLLVSENRLN
jgi:hypothetical protein